MKYILVLIANGLFILYSILFFADHKFIPSETGARIRNLLLLGAALYVSYNVLFIYILKKETEQSGIIYKIASGIKHFVLNSYTFIQPFQKEFIISLAIAAVIIIVSLILAGLPGGLIILLFQKIGMFNKIEGDNTWPAAIFLSCFWPICFPVAVLTKNYLVQHQYAAYAVAGMLCSGFVWVISMMITTVLLFGKTA